MMTHEHDPSLSSGSPEVLPTELSNPASRGIDVKSSREIVEIIHREDLRAWEAVGTALDSIALVVEEVVQAFRAGGRLVYVGAGTSGRLGVLAIVTIVALALVVLALVGYLVWLAMA